MTDNTESMAGLWSFLDRKLEGKIDAESLIAVLGLIDLYAIFSSSGVRTLPATGNGSELAAGIGGSPAQTLDLKQTINSLLSGPLGEKLPPTARAALDGMLQPPAPAEDDQPAGPVPDHRNKATDSLSLLSSLSSLLGSQSGPPRLDPIALLALLSLFGRRERREIRSPENPPEKITAEGGDENNANDKLQDAAETAKSESTPELKKPAEPVRVSHRSFGDRRER